MRFLDTNPLVVGWAYEPFSIPYVSPIDGKVHKYIVDFIAQVERNGRRKTLLMEVKPRLQTPESLLSQLTKIRGTSLNRNSVLNRVLTVSINDAKWKAARAVCEKKGWEFKLITEKEIGLD